MLAPGPTTKIYLATGSTDMRKGFNGLYSLARGVMEADPLSGHLFVFSNRSRTLLKILFWDGSGLWVCAKRLEKGTFAWPKANAPSVQLSQAQLHLLLGGLDLTRTHKRQWI